MPKPHKIKHYHKRNTTYRARPHPVIIVLGIFAVCALVFVGVSIYEPVKNAFTGRIQPVLPQYSEADPGPDDAETNPDPEPERPVMQLQGDVHAVWLPHAIATDNTSLDAFLLSLRDTEINTVMVELKDSDGMVLFQTANEQAAEWGAVSENAIDLAAFSKKLEENNLQLAVRIHTFRDAVAANGNRDNAIRYQGGDWLWLDNAADAGGRPWLNPYSEGAYRYLADLALEAADQGAVLIMLDDVQFADGSGSANATFGDAAGTITRQEALHSFVEKITTEAEEKGAQVGVYLSVSTITQTAQNEVRYGGSPLMVLDDTLILGLLPYQFGGSFSADGLEITEPLQNPAAAVTASIAYVQGLWTGTGGGEQNLIVLLQGGSEMQYNSTTAFTSIMLQAQISAASTAGCDQYILYQTGGEYLLP